MEHAEEPCSVQADALVRSCFVEEPCSVQADALVRSCFVLESVEDEGVRLDIIGSSGINQRTLYLPSKPFDRESKLFAVFSYCSAANLITFFVQRLGQFLVRKRFEFVFCGNQIP